MWVWVKADSNVSVTVITPNDDWEELKSSELTAFVVFQIL